MKKIYLFLVLIFLSACSDKDERPNILFIMSDDHAYQAISAYSDKLIQTPNIDRIADEGILFTDDFSSLFTTFFWSDDFLALIFLSSEVIHFLFANYISNKLDL